MRPLIDPEKVIDIIENEENIKLIEYQKYMIREYISKINGRRIPLCHELQKVVRGEPNETLSSSGEGG